MFDNCRCGKLTPEGGEKLLAEEVDSNARDSQKSP
jgi:hypothetical protein